MALPELPQQVSIRDLRGIIRDKDGLGVARVAPAGLCVEEEEEGEVEVEQQQQM